MNIALPPLLLSAVLLAGCASPTPAPTPVGSGGAGQAAGIATGGQALFDAHCARCHAPESIGTKPPMFVTVVPLVRGAMDPARAAYVEGIVRHGGKSVDRSALMPAFEGDLTEAQITEILKWIATAP